MSCCNRKRTLKDFLFLPLAVGTSILGLAVLLTVEMGIAYAIGVL